MSSKEEQDPLMDHAYDGIQEYDNPLPGWWTAIFVASILFAVGYGVWYHLGGPGVSEVEAYEAEMSDYYAMKAKQGGKLQVTDEMVAMLSKNTAALGGTAALFQDKCAECHAKDGGGGIGPNLTDDYWINGDGKGKAVHAVIRDGVPKRGMQAWGKKLKENELFNLSAYVLSLRGTTPAKPKDPQGEKVEQ